MFVYLSAIGHFASEMTYIVSSGALNSTPTNQLSASISPELHLQFSQFFAHVTSATLPQVHSWTILHLQNNGCQPAVSRTKKKTQHSAVSYEHAYTCQVCRSVSSQDSSES